MNTGACDDLAAICELAHRHSAWVHVDGAFGLWAAASPSKRHLVRGLEQADSWAVDGHKWLQVPYDAGFVFCADAEAHAASMASPPRTSSARARGTYVLESSRRARGFATWAALRELGRQGIAEVVDRCCALAERFAERLAALDGVEIGNEVVLNQALASFGSDERTDRLVAAAQQDGTFWAGRDHLARPPLHADLDLQLVDDRSGVDRSVDAIERLLSELAHESARTKRRRCASRTRLAGQS